ncbi:MAG TPA: acetylornithine transaminase [Pseudogracilibacillus sp.]|nr:acetylornithine transaminase [Pseudogracilibacillus sp.]
MVALFPTYQRFPLAVQQAEGTTVVDTNGKTYLDFGSGIGVNNLGHRHPQVQKAIEKQLNAYWHVSNLYEVPIQEEVANLLAENSAGDAVFFANSGAEANEAAIKLARKATGKDKIITFNQSFHGRTFATMAATGQEKVRTGYGEMLPTFMYATFNDIHSVRKLIDEDTAAVMIEMVQGEGGIHPIDPVFLNELTDLLKAHGVLLIVDEIQTGIGRTGTAFAYEQYGIEPDIFTVAKGLANGIPIGAMIAKDKYLSAFQSGAHGSTFGGNPIAMAAAKAVLEKLFEERFLKEVNEKITYIQAQLQQKIEPLSKVKTIRTNGLMIGIELHEVAGPFVGKLLQEGLLVLSAGEKVIRLLPPLVVTKQEINQAVEKIETILEQ